MSIKTMNKNISNFFSKCVEITTEDFSIKKVNVNANNFYTILYHTVSKWTTRNHFDYFLTIFDSGYKIDVVINEYSLIPCECDDCGDDEIETNKLIIFFINDRFAFQMDENRLYINCANYINNYVLMSFTYDYFITMINYNPELVADSHIDAEKYALMPYMPPLIVDYKQLYFISCTHLNQSSANPLYCMHCERNVITNSPASKIIM